jgi:hypothetical protein
MNLNTLLLRIAQGGRMEEALYVIKHWVRGVVAEDGRAR